MARAGECGLEFDLAPLGRLGLDIRPDWNGRLVDSRTGLYKLVPEYVRPIEPAHDNTAVAPEAWQRFDADPAYREFQPAVPPAGRADVAICGAADFALVEPIVAGFATMNGAFSNFCSKRCVT